MPARQPPHIPSELLRHEEPHGSNNHAANGPGATDSPYPALRAAETNEMLERTPSWLLRWGGISVTGVFVLLFGVAVMIRYPDTVEGKAVITTNPLPIQLKPMAAGRIATLFVPDRQTVKEGIPIAEIENNTGHRYIVQLAGIADSVTIHLATGNLTGLQKVLQYPLLSLGEAQPVYNSLLQGISAYLLLKQEHIYAKREGNLLQQTRRYQSVANITTAESRLITEELKQAAERFRANEQLYQDKVISKTEYFEEAAKLRQRKLALDAQQRNALQHTITMGDNDKQLLEMAYDKAEKERTLHIAIEESVRNLQNFIQSWKRQYLLIAPYDGKLQYLRPVQVNEVIATGDAIFTVVPLAYHNTAYINLPSAGLGKVQQGQTVHLLLEKYPYQEYGYLEGKVAAISELPLTVEGKDAKEQVYRVAVILPDSLVSSYHKLIPFSPEMPATARIITKDRNLLQRLIAGLMTVNK